MPHSMSCLDCALESYKGSNYYWYMTQYKCKKCDVRFDSFLNRYVFLVLVFRVLVLDEMLISVTFTFGQGSCNLDPIDS